MNHADTTRMTTSLPVLWYGLDARSRPLRAHTRRPRTRAGALKDRRGVFTGNCGHGAYASYSRSNAASPLPASVLPAASPLFNYENALFLAADSLPWVLLALSTSLAGRKSIAAAQTRTRAGPRFGQNGRIRINLKAIPRGWTYQQHQVGQPFPPSSRLAFAGRRYVV